LFVAILAAADALQVEPVVIVSLGASSFGANTLEFTLLEVSSLLRQQELLPHSIAAASLGGSRDIGSEFDPVVRISLLEKIRASGIPLIEDGNLTTNVETRMAIYGADSATGRIRAFVNIGGGYADMGADPWILGLGPGVHRTVGIPHSVISRGMLMAMADKGIPVIHLLYVKGLVERYGLPWDPVPLAGVGRKIDDAQSDGGGGKFWVVLALYLIGMSIVFYLYNRGAPGA
jgi:poly-gamma-glutamate system protein